MKHEHRTGATTLRRVVPGELLALATIAVVLLLGGLFWLGQAARWRSPAARPVTTAAGQAAPIISETDALTLVRHCDELLQAAQARDLALDQTQAQTPEPSQSRPSAWAGRMAAGRADPADFLMRVFTAPAYLAGNPDDQTFLRDAARVVTGADPDQTTLAAAQASLEKLGSRLAYLNTLVAGQNWRGQINLPGDATRLRTFQLVNDLPQNGSEIVGLLPVHCDVRLTGGNARFTLFVDGHNRMVQAVNAAEPTVQNTYTITWDTRAEKSGSHSAAMLLLTGDGRGQWVELASYVLPELTRLTGGQVLALPAAPATGGTAWCELPVIDSQALLLAVGADKPIRMDMFDLYTRPLAGTTGVAAQPAAIRHRFVENPPDAVFVKVSLEPATSGLSLVAALAAARPADEPATLLAVLGIQDESLQICDAAGKTSWQPRSQYVLIDPTGSLAKFNLLLPGGSDAGLAPDFDPAVLEYGLSVEANDSTLTLQTLAMEGSAASLAVRLTSGQAAQPDRTQPGIPAGGPVSLPAGESTLFLSVTGYDGSIRDYAVHILRPPDLAGFHTTLARFPATYRSALYLLHVRRPAWQFEPGQTTVGWPDFLSAENRDGLNLVDAANSPASWVEPGSPVYDGSSWKAATSQVIAHFADPRNFLDEQNIFQFEKLGFLETVHTKAGVEALIRDSFMGEGNTRDIDYASLILDAGRQAGISPYFLASKIIQEMGRRGESPLATGTLPGFAGVFNFYNIGATPDPGVPNGAQINGALFALYGRDAAAGEITPEEAAWLIPWTSPQRAISGGALWIAGRYVGIGQNTLYLQKFDLVGEDGLYVHQYAQNIQMAWAEGRRVQSAYAALGLLDQPFVFSLPVFTGQPAHPAALPEPGR
jgi:beta-N-acetylglucosaminidase